LVSWAVGVDAPSVQDDEATAVYSIAATFFVWPPESPVGAQVPSTTNGEPTSRHLAPPWTVKDAFEHAVVTLQLLQTEQPRVTVSSTTILRPKGVPDGQSVSPLVAMQAAKPDGTVPKQTDSAFVPGTSQ
jgi:hypothetical protein